MTDPRYAKEVWSKTNKPTYSYNTNLFGNGEDLEIKEEARMVYTHKGIQYVAGLNIAPVNLTSKTVVDPDRAIIDHNDTDGNKSGIKNRSLILVYFVDGESYAAPIFVIGDGWFMLEGQIFVRKPFKEVFVTPKCVNYLKSQDAMMEDNFLSDYHYRVGSYLSNKGVNFHYIPLEPLPSLTK